MIEYAEPISALFTRESKGIMEFQTLFNIAVSVGLPALGWALRTMYDDIRKLGTDLSDHRVASAEKFATKADMSASIDRMERAFEVVGEKIDRVLDKLERKADR